jgi:hypothetical protein
MRFAIPDVFTPFAVMAGKDIESTFFRSEPERECCKNSLFVAMAFIPIPA